MNITIFVKKRKKEKFFVKAEKEYEKRIKKYGKISFNEYKTLDQIGKLLREEEPLIVINEKEGKQISSEKLAEKLVEMEVKGISRISVLIGQDSPETIHYKGNIIKISVSRMSLSDEILGVVVMEQIFRAYKIISGETYHK